MANVTIFAGEYRGTKVRNETFRLMSDVKTGAKGLYVTVQDNGTLGYKGKSVKVKIKSMEDITVSGQTIADMSDSQRNKANKDVNVFSLVTTKEKCLSVESLLTECALS